MSRCIRVVDSTLRDGSHAVSHQFSGEQIAAVAEGLDKAGVPFIEVSHGDGLGDHQSITGRLSSPMRKCCGRFESNSKRSPHCAAASGNRDPGGP